MGFSGGKSPSFSGLVTQAVDGLNGTGAPAAAGMPPPPPASPSIPIAPSKAAGVTLGNTAGGQQTLGGPAQILGY